MTDLKSAASLAGPALPPGVAPLVAMPESAHTVLSARHAMVQATGSSLVSPCVGVCRMDADSGWCLGCLRTLEEIRQWANAPQTYRVAVWGAIGTRLRGQGQE